MTDQVCKGPLIVYNYPKAWLLYMPPPRRWDHAFLTMCSKVALKRNQSFFLVSSTLCFHSKIAGSQTVRKKSAQIQKKHSPFPLNSCCLPWPNKCQDCKAFYMRLNEDGKTVAAMDLLCPGRTAW